MLLDRHAICVVTTAPGAAKQSSFTANAKLTGLRAKSQFLTDAFPSVFLVPMSFHIQILSGGSDSV
jgi:hypothetical protein